MSALRELLAIFSVKVESDDLKKADNLVESFGEKLKSFAAGAFWVEAAHMAAEFVEGQVEAAAHLQDLAERLDVSAVAIKDFGFAAKSVGIDLETAAHSLGILERTMGAALHGGGEQAKTFRELGISLRNSAGQAKPMEDVMGDVAEAFARLPDQATRAAFATKLFGREGIALVPVLAKGRESMQELFAESHEFGSGLGGDFYKATKAVREEFEHFGAAVQALKERALAAILPYVDKVGKFLERIGKGAVELSKHTTVLKSAMVALGAVIGVGLVTAIGTLLAALAPFAIPIAIVGALFVVFDDLFALFSGQESVIGDIIDQLFGIGTAAQFVKDMNEAFEATIDVAEDLGDVIKEVIVGAIEQAFDAAKGVGEALGDIASGNFKAAWEDLKKAGGEMTKDLGKRGKHIAADASDLGDDVTLSAKTRAQKRKVDRNNRRVEAGGPGTMMAPEYGENTGGTGTREPETVAIPGHAGAHTTHHEQNTQNHYETTVTVNGVPTDKAQKVGGAVGTEVDRVHKKNAANTLQSRKVP